MKTEDVCRLFNLLEQLYHGKQKTRDRATLAIWDSVLKPWSYEDVRAAVIKRARENRYFPDPSELAEYLPPVDVNITNDYTWALPHIIKNFSRFSEERRAEYHAAGLPTFPEAQERGMKWDEWIALCRQAFQMQEAEQP